MNEFWEIIFFFLIFLCLNSYLFYPVIIIILSSFKSNKFFKQPELFEVSVLISVFNEEKVIKERIENIINQNYDKQKIEILIGSDCSDDETNMILKNLRNKIPQLKIFLFEKRRGKGAVLNDLVLNATNKILIFSDANSMFEPNAIQNLIKHFNNPEIGGVSGKLILKENYAHFSKGIEEKQYWEYETLIKKAEGKLGILIGANGGIFAIRKELYKPISLNKPVTDDLFISLSILNQGYKFVYEPDAIAVEEISNDIKTEFRRKIRFSATNFQTILFFKSLLFNKNFLMSYAFWSHKVFRWFFPHNLILIFLLNLILFNSAQFYKYSLFSQIAIYVLGLIGYFLIQINIEIKFFSLLTYFLMTNYAILVGFVKFLRKEHSLMWVSTPR